MYKEFIGFDIRLLLEDYIGILRFWNEQEREVFLLRSEIKWPLSIDKVVWPSIFYYFRIPDQRVIKKIIKLDPKKYFPVWQLELSVWNNLEEMKTVFFSDKSNLMKRGIVIGVEVVSEKPLSYIEYDDIGIAMNETSDKVPVLPNECPKDWIFLGYDVATNSISGLTNCGYEKEEKKMLQPIWVPRLNEHGLINNLEDALEFKNLIDKRMLKHGRFYVYGLYRDPNIIVSPVTYKL